MGHIGPRQQRYEVLPAEAYDVSDLLRTWRDREPPSENDDSAEQPTHRGVRASSPDRPS